MANLLDDGTFELLHHPPEYHGNPVGDGKSLVTWRYGDDFESLLSQWAGLLVTTYVTRDWSPGVYAEFNEVFVMKNKSRHVHRIVSPASRHRSPNS